MSVLELDFVFKGGTSLLLLLDRMHRFSIDIDIIIENINFKQNLDELFQQLILNNQVFSRFEKNERKSLKNFTKVHYKFFYNSILTNNENYILLDILFEGYTYSSLIYKPIRCEFLDTIGQEVMVRVPSIDNILGDKLTAFAPNTTGILFGQRKELEIIKQMFDVSNLFDQINKIETVKESFMRIVGLELSYRNLEKSLGFIDVLDDIFETSRILSYRGKIEPEIFNMLEDGVIRIKSYIFSQNYIIERAVNSASKVAYLSLILKYNITEVIRFDPTINLNECKIEYKQLNGLKSILKFDPEAYFFWYQCSLILMNTI